MSKYLIILDLRVGGLGWNCLFFESQSGPRIKSLELWFIHKGGEQMPHTIIESCSGCGACIRSCPAHAITGKPKELHVINQVKCVDCSVCGFTCPTRSVVSFRGAVVKRVEPRIREKPMVDQDICTACSLCMDICRFGAIELSQPQRRGDIQVWALPNHSKCVGCQLCALVCPVDAIEMEVSKP